MRRIKLCLAFALFAGLFVSLAGEAHAFGQQVTTRKEYRSGTARVAELTGTYRLDAYETLTDVRIVSLDANGRELSVAQGTFNPTNGTWAVGLGDFQMVSYYVKFTIRYGNATRYYYTPTYRWGVR
ncbi:hypothetical protein GobsT_17710 [Gemmata obscuriglobus]|uniref:Uncharacterized protein n=1 Tax=Gemmata obscuriglobus TaxID=114 RepID=A0A2Z3H8F1_9BACT|nr:hypothetical protein [Gemmata obscuriglobus]AWM39856.1 hypothetical protein C1280_24500 [Gemmata obscuriglobus]QEG27018.1 hypothetical protein GobsT_17710 [Gemmata obscuriglobus]VTS03347.1 unnamed protein product [Gemmata obscuriglobus UQM 2246]